MIIFFPIAVNFYNLNKELFYNGIVNEMHKLYFWGKFLDGFFEIWKFFELSFSRRIYSQIKWFTFVYGKPIIIFTGGTFLNLLIILYIILNVLHQKNAPLSFKYQISLLPN